MIEKALQQNEPTKIGEYFLTATEKEHLIKALRAYLDINNVNDVLEDVVRISKKLGVYKELFNH